VSLATPGLAALAALLPVLVAYADAPWRTFGQRYVAHRWPERMVLFSIELNLLLLWALAKLLVSRDAALAQEGLRGAFAGAGALLAWSGAALAVWAKLVLGRWFSASFGVKRGHQLVTRGPYAVVRHPMYVAFVALALGIAIAWDSWVSVGFALLYVVPFWMHTAIEEQMLEAQFGDEWRAYRARVPRLVPGWRGRLTATPSPRP
jgi:protein-S-isoprenylcysteine O-methyltransferase Ste14